MFKLNFYFKHIGDQICTTALPENIFHATGEKCIITDPAIWAFRHNPYVVHMDESQCPSDALEINVIPDNRVAEQRQHYLNVHKTNIGAGQTHYMATNIGIDNPVLRHPRLYIYEDLEREPDKIIINTAGSDRTRDNEPAVRFNFGEDRVRILDQEIIDQILKNYKNYRIYQVGSINDRPVGGHSVDLRGIDYWDSIKEIATASRFIGVDSGPRHMASCYPGVDIRVVLVQYPESTLKTSRPGDINHWLFSWLDPTHTYFNRYQHDIAYTFSYKKI